MQRRFRSFVWCTLAWSLLGGCGDGGADADADAGDATVHYEILLASHPGIAVFIDGVEWDANAGAFTTRYVDVAEARASPLFRIHTEMDAVRVDEIEIGIGACERVCADYLALGCSELAVTTERVPAAFNPDGVFWAASADPRAWRGEGCLDCAFVDGSQWFLCT